MQSPTTDRPDGLDTLSIRLHWLVGLIFIALLAVGFYMEMNEAYALYDLHKSFGLIILLPVVARIAWRLRQGWLPAEAGDAQWQQTLARVVQIVLLLATALMPVSGILMSVGGGHDLALFGWELVAANPDPNDPHEVIAPYPALAGLGHSVHGILGNLVTAALVLHVAGALKHHLMDKGDHRLRRMLGQSSSQ